jgi:hypothetical protein
MNTLITVFLDNFIFEHPETIMQGIMHVLVTWLGAPNSNDSDDLEVYREHKLRTFRDLLQYMQKSMEREKDRRLDIAVKPLYIRKSFPPEQELPIYQRERAKEIAKTILDHLQRLAPHDPLRLYSELTVAWFFACPKVLLQLAPRFLGEGLDYQSTDVDYADALWFWFQQYLVDPTWFS